MFMTLSIVCKNTALHPSADYLVMKVRNPNNNNTGEINENSIQFKDGETPIYSAAHYGHTEIVKILAPYAFERQSLCQII